MCQACRGLIESSVRTCPLCGRDAVPAARARVSERGGNPHFVSRLFLTINIVLFVLMALVEVRNGLGPTAFFQSASGLVLTDFGSCHPALIRMGEWWRVVTPNFLHLGLIHLLFNSFVLYQIGPQVEEIFSSQKFIFIYLSTGIISMSLSALFGIGGGGASGALYGLIGLLAVYGYRLGGAFGRALMRQMLMWAAIGIMISFGIRANNVAHISGMIAGAGLGFLLAAEAPQTSRAASWWNVTAVASAVLIMASFVMVAVNYGTAQRANDVVRLSNRVRSSTRLLARSFDWSGPSDRNPREIAGELRISASDVERIPSLDPPSDEIKRRLVDLLNRRATSFDAAEQSVSSPVLATSADSAELDQLWSDYDEWEVGVLGRYRLERTVKPEGESRQ